MTRKTNSRTLRKYKTKCNKNNKKPKMVKFPFALRLNFSGGQFYKEISKFIYLPKQKKIENSLNVWGNWL